MLVKCNDGVPYSAKNPYWYKFTCFKSGTLSFVIDPNTNSDDYDWQLYDVTNVANLSSILNSDAYTVCNNWSSRPDKTGTSNNTNGLINCAGPAYPNFSTWPNIIAGRNYLLLVSHYDDISEDGYSLSFGGGTASITDTLPPKMQTARASCDGTAISVTLNKKMQCKTLANDGSDFSISPATGAKIQSILGYGCSTSFDVDSVQITLDKALLPGNYSLTIDTGKDANTLLDNCNTPIPDQDSVPFIVYAIQPTPMDSIKPVGCAPDTLYLVFRNQIKCSTIDNDGSDFFVTGTSPVTIKGAGGNCINGLSNIVKVWFTQPIKIKGNYTIRLKTGNDGYTLLDECGQETLSGSSLPFATVDTVSAAFTYKLGLGCNYDTISCTHPGLNSVNKWNWTFDSNGSSIFQNPVFLFPDYGNKKITLLVSNGVCTDSDSIDILLDNELKALFTAPAELCPEDAVTFANNSIGKIVTYNWTFGDGTTSILKDPPAKNYPPAPTRTGRIYPVTLVVQNDLGCRDTLTEQMKLLYTCFIDVPTGFTPNGDGLNDYLFPLNAYKANNLEFRVYNRLGQLIFQTKDWTRKWDGTLNGNPQGSGVYVWTLVYTDSDTGLRISIKGTTVLIR